MEPGSCTPGAVHAHLRARAQELAAADPTDLGRIRTIVDRLAIDARPLPTVKLFRSHDAAARGVWVIPEGADPDRRIVYCHGCGFMAGSIDLYAGFLSRLAVAAEACLFFVDYRLAPEHVFPSAHEDCLNAFLWARGRGPERSNPAAACFLAGDSCGAGLALSTALAAARDNAGPAAVVALSPFVDLSVSGDSTLTNEGRDPLLTRDMAKSCASVYAPAMDPCDSRLSPLFADLSSLPRIQVQGTTSDLLRDDALRLAERAQRAGVQTELHMWSHLSHPWYLFPGELPEATAGIELAGRFLRQD